MNISPYTKFPDLKLEPLNFDFMLKAKAMQDAKQDAALKTLDETTGLLAALNAAPGNEKWAKDVAGKYNTMLGKVANDVGKVPIQQTVSDARRIKADFLNNPDVKTILNNKEYYDKILAPYMANKEAQLNVPGGTMAQYMEPGPNGGYNFKQNQVSYAGTLSYQPYADFNKRYFDVLEKVKNTVVPKDASGNYVPTTIDEHGNLYWVENNQRKYIKDSDTFKNAIDGLSNTILNQRDPEARWYKANLEFHGQGDYFNKENISKELLELSKPLWGSDIQGSTDVHQITGGTGASQTGRGTSTATPKEEGVPTLTLGNVVGAITPDEELQAIDVNKTASYLQNKPEHITDVFSGLQKNNVFLQNRTPQDLKITREVDPKTNKVNYNIGVTEDQFVQSLPVGVRDQGRQQYRNMAIEFNAEALNQQTKLNLWQRAKDNVMNKILGPVKNPGEPGYNAQTQANRQQILNFFDTVENYNAAPTSHKNELNKMLFNTLEAMQQGEVDIETTEDGWEYEGDFQNAPSTKNYKARLKSIKEDGIIPLDVKQHLYREMGERYPTIYKPLLNYADRISEGKQLQDPKTVAQQGPDSLLESKDVQDEYQKLYEADQAKSYKIISFDLPSTPADKTTYLAKLQQKVTESLKSDYGVAQNGKKVWNYAPGLSNYVYYTLGSPDLKSKSWNGRELFSSDTGFKGVDIQGIIYDKESGFWWTGNLKGKDNVGEVVLVRPENQEEFNSTIINNMSLHPGTGETMSSIKTVLESMPISKLGTQEVRQIDASDKKVQKIFDAFGMTDVFITGNDQVGYDMNYKSLIPGVKTDPETGKVPTYHYDSIADLSDQISQHGVAYNEVIGKK